MPQLCAFHSLIHPAFCVLVMSHVISFAKSRPDSLSWLHKQRENSKGKEGQLPLPVPCNLSSGVCTVSLFLESCKSSARNSLITVILLSTKENELQHHIVLPQISLSEVRLMAEICARMFSSARRAFYLDKKYCTLLFAYPYYSLHCRLIKKQC